MIDKVPTQCSVCGQDLFNHTVTCAFFNKFCRRSDMGHHAESGDNDDFFYRNHPTALQIAQQEKEKLQIELKRLESFLHSKCFHPDYEYRETEGQRKCWDGEPNLTLEGWDINTDHFGGWERFEYTESRYWRRLKPPPVPTPLEEQGYVPD